MSYQDVYRRWAEHEYGLDGVTNVEFVFNEGEPDYSEFTPGEDASCEVHIWQGERITIRSVAYDTELINSILDVMRDGR